MVVEVTDVRKHFGGISALDGMSMTVSEGEVVGLIGPNGAGKTTLFDVISGLQRADEGEVRLRGAIVSQLPPHRIFRAGLARTMQAGGVFEDLTVRENLRIACARTSLSDEEFTARADELLAMTRLTRLAEHPAGQLSYGQQRLLEFAMAVVGKPHVVLLDEPVAGVTPAVIDELGELIRRLNSDGLTFVIVEHNVPFVSAVSSRLVAMAQGRLIAEGTPDYVRGHAEVKERYLSGG
jgi:branched-chain amino acid transport system ATP-binding protein